MLNAEIFYLNIPKEKKKFSTYNKLTLTSIVKY